LTKLISIWGKGGVGKSTCASAIAYSLANKHKKTLLITTDFVPTISKIFGIKGCGFINVPNIPDLYLLEVHPNEVIAMWKEKFGPEVYRVVSSILPVTEEIIDYIAGAPGLADEFMLYVIYEKWREGDMDYIIWDLPAAGDALRLLWLEKQFYTHLGDAAKMYLKLKGYLSKLFRREESPYDLLEKWRKLAEDMLAMLTSEDHKALIIITPDDLSVEIAKQIISDLNSFKISIEALIINMIWPSTKELMHRFSKRLSMQEYCIQKIKDLAYDRRVKCIEIPYLDINPLKDLEVLCKELEPLIKSL